MAKGRGVSRGLGSGEAQVIGAIPEVDYGGVSPEQQAEAAKGPEREWAEAADIDAIPEDTAEYVELRDMLVKKRQEYDMLQNKGGGEANRVYQEYQNGLRALRNYADVAKPQKEQYDKYIQTFIDDPKYDQADVERIAMEYTQLTPFERLERERGGLPSPKLAPIEKQPWHPNFIKEVDSSIREIVNEDGNITIEQVYADPNKTQELVKMWVENNKDFEDRGGGAIDRFDIPVTEQGEIQWNTPEGQKALNEMTKDITFRAKTKYKKTEDEDRNDWNINFGSGGYRDDKYTYSYQTEGEPNKMTYEEFVQSVGGEDVPRSSFLEYLDALKEMKGNDAIFVGRTDASENKLLRFETGEGDEAITAVPLGVVDKNGTKKIVVVEKTEKGIGGDTDRYRKVELPYTAANRAKLANEYKYRTPEDEIRNFDYEEMIKLFKEDEGESTPTNAEDVKSKYGIEY